MGDLTCWRGPVFDMDDRDLIRYLEENRIWHRMVEKSEETVHTKDASEKSGVPLERLTKSLVLIEDGMPFICIIPGNCKLDFGKLRKVIGSKKIYLCEFDDAHLYSGYDPGATPPVHYRKISKVVMDEKLLKHRTIFGGGGHKKRIVELRASDVANLNKAIIGDISNII
jgi:Cys-tRNA(Pro) deacylase